MSKKCTVNRREFMRISVGAAALGLGGCRNRQFMRVTKQPNIVFIIADDMGWKDIVYHGSEIMTPNLDQLAKTGRVFDQHYVMPTCTPTRVGLLSGQYPSRYGVLGPDYGKIFDDDTLTLAEVLKRCGYTTHIAGKWHVGSAPEYTPMKYGFTSSYGYFAGQIDPYTHLYKTGEKTWHHNDEIIDESGHVTGLITDNAIEYIKAQHTKPFFLYVAFSVPHYPLKEPSEWLAMYPDIQEESRKWFAASVSHMDDGIGKIVGALDETGMRKNTLLVFVSDNGGQKNWPFITGATKQIVERTFYWKTSGASALRMGDWKLIVYRVDGQIELFNLKNDPLEKNDLAKQESQRVMELKVVLEQIASRDRENISLY